MNDPRIAALQVLHWQIESLTALGARGGMVRAKHREAATMYEERARELVGLAEAHGWTDLFAGVTHWTLAGEKPRALALLRFGAEQARSLDDDSAGVSEQLDELMAWMAATPVLPSLSGFARALPALPRLAA
jgi:hypothetical protein